MMAWTKPEPLLPEVEFKDFIEGRILNVEDTTRHIHLNQISVLNGLSKIEVRLARIEDLLKKKRA